MEHEELVARVSNLESQVMLMAGFLSIFSAQAQANSQAVIGILEAVARHEDVPSHVIKNLEIGTAINLAGLTNQVSFDQYERTAGVLKHALSSPAESEISINLQ